MRLSDVDLPLVEVVHHLAVVGFFGELQGSETVGVDEFGVRSGSHQHFDNGEVAEETGCVKGAFPILQQ